MILAAAALVLLGLGLFVAGVLTGVTALYWGCVAACAVAAVLLVLARRRIPAARPAKEAPPAEQQPGARVVDTAPAEKPAAQEQPAQEPPAEEPAAEELGDPPPEDVEVTDLLLVVDLKDEVLVIDEHPRYHLAGCLHLRGRTTIPLPHDEARADGFTPCGVCQPDSTLADQVRARKSARGS